MRIFCWCCEVMHWLSVVSIMICENAFMYLINTHYALRKLCIHSRQTLYYLHFSVVTFIKQLHYYYYYYYTICMSPVTGISSWYFS